MARFPALPTRLLQSSVEALVRLRNPHPPPEYAAGAVAELLLGPLSSAWEPTRFEAALALLFHHEYSGMPGLFHLESSDFRLGQALAFAGLAAEMIVSTGEKPVASHDLGYLEPELDHDLRWRRYLAAALCLESVALPYTLELRRKPLRFDWSATRASALTTLDALASSVRATTDPDGQRNLKSLFRALVAMRALARCNRDGEQVVLHHRLEHLLGAKGSDVLRKRAYNKSLHCLIMQLSGEDEKLPAEKDVDCSMFERIVDLLGQCREQLELTPQPSQEVGGGDEATEEHHVIFSPFQVRQSPVLPGLSTLEESDVGTLGLFAGIELCERCEELNIDDPRALRTAVHEFVREAIPAVVERSTFQLAVVQQLEKMRRLRPDWPLPRRLKPLFVDAWTALPS